MNLIVVVCHKNNITESISYNAKVIQEGVTTDDSAEAFAGEVFRELKNKFPKEEFAVIPIVGFETATITTVDKTGVENNEDMRLFWSYISGKQLKFVTKNFLIGDILDANGDFIFFEEDRDFSNFAGKFVRLEDGTKYEVLTDANWMQDFKTIVGETLQEYAEGKSRIGFDFLDFAYDGIPN